LTWTATAPPAAWRVMSSAGSRRGGRFGVFSPRKLGAKAIGALGGVGGLWRYLEGGREQVDYYLGADGSPSEALVELRGRLVGRLGLTSLDELAFERLAAGCHPHTGTRLVKTSHVLRLDPTTGEPHAQGGQHVPGIDCNLSPPKSVSALLPFLSPEGRAGLEQAHLAAVRVTLDEIEQRVAVCRPTISGEQVHATGELAVAVFTHHTSRPTAEVDAEPGRPPDPQLHSHAFIFNLAFCQGRYLAVDSKPLYRFAGTAEAIYACELAAQLQQLGYQLQWHQTRTGRAWELAGVDKRLVELFSSRHRQIERQAAEFQARRGRPPDKVERARLAAQQRHAKITTCLQPHWPAYRAVLDRHQLRLPSPRRSRLPLVPRSLTTREATVRDQLLAPDGLNREDATFTAEEVTTAYRVATGLLDAAQTRAFLQRFLTGQDLVPIASPSGPRFTTASLLAQEQSIASTALRKLRTPSPAPTQDLIDQAAAEVAAESGYQLSAEQLAAVRHLCAPVGWASLEGWAGTGKTTAVRTVARAFRANRQHPVVVATAAETARRTAHAIGLDRGYTVEAFTHAVHTGELRPRVDWVVIVEEACMVDTHRMATLLKAAGPASIRTLGDPEQAQAIGPGGWHAQVDQLIGGHAELTTVVRQRHPADRAACRAIRDGHAPDALADLRHRGRIHLTTSPEVAIKEIVHAWDRHRVTHGLDGVQILTDTDNHTIDTLNALCQAKRLASGELSGQAVEVIDRVTGRRERLHAGDRVRFIRPHQTPNTHVLNGTAGTISCVDPDHGRVTIVYDDHRTATLQPAMLEDAQPLRLGYAGHVLKLQGGQAAVVLLPPGSWQTCRQSAYSMATRCVEELHLFVDHQTQCTGPYLDWDPIDALADRWTRDAKKVAATLQLDLHAGPRDSHVSDLSARPHAISWPVERVSEPPVSCTWISKGERSPALPSLLVRQDRLNDHERSLDFD
jgi:conjugative relaxase-like TrwC/TraI family protein